MMKGMGNRKIGRVSITMFSPLKKTSAFSLVELMVVILILGVMVALVVPVYVSAKDVAERNVCLHNQRSIEYALVRWRADHPDEEFVTDKCLPKTEGEAFLDLDGNALGDKSRSLAEYFGEGSGPFDCPSNGKGVGERNKKCDYITDGYVVACLTDNKRGVKADGTTFKKDTPRTKNGWSHLDSEDEDKKADTDEDKDDNSNDDKKDNSDKDKNNNSDKDKKKALKQGMIIG